MYVTVATGSCDEGCDANHNSRKAQKKKEMGRFARRKKEKKERRADGVKSKAGPITGDNGWRQAPDLKVSSSRVRRADVQGEREQKMGLPAYPLYILLNSPMRSGVCRVVLFCSLVTKGFKEMSWNIETRTQVSGSGQREHANRNEKPSKV
jgi:hypothetical protein